MLARKEGPTLQYKTPSMLHKKMPQFLWNQVCIRIILKSRKLQISLNLTFLRKPGLTIKPTTKDGNVLIIVNANPAIIIDIPDDTECTLRKLKLSHSGEGEK